jgi:hypothetical protein
MPHVFTENQNKIAIYFVILSLVFLHIGKQIDSLDDILGGLAVNICGCILYIYGGNLLNEIRFYFNRRNKINTIYKSIGSGPKTDEVKNILNRYIPDFIKVLRTEVKVKYEDIIYCSGSNRIIYILKVNNIDCVMFIKINDPSTIAYDNSEFKITHFNAIQINRIVEEMVGL